jgi:hypothetical protein
MERKQMTNQQLQTIEAAVGEAIEALPNGNDRQLTEYVMEHCFPSFTSDIREAMLEEGLKVLIDQRRGTTAEKGEAESLEERRLTIMRLRREAKADMRHAVALEAETESLIQQGALIDGQRRF